MKWITREPIKVNRLACPWFIRRFVHLQAQFLCSGETLIRETAARELKRLALIVRPADIKGQKLIAVGGIGLRALAALNHPDEKRLVEQFPIYGAPDEYARQAP